MDSEKIRESLVAIRHSADNTGTIGRNFYHLVDVCQSLLEEVEELKKQLVKREAPAKEEGEFKKGEVVIVTGLKYCSNTFALPCLGVVEEGFDEDGVALVEVVNRDQEIKGKWVCREYLQKLPVKE